jgi:hypothetical protein
LQTAKQSVEVTEVGVDAWERTRPNLRLGFKDLAEDIADVDEVARVRILAQAKSSSSA